MRFCNLDLFELRFIILRDRSFSPYSDLFTTFLNLHFSNIINHPRIVVGEQDNITFTFALPQGRGGGRRCISDRRCKGHEFFLDHQRTGIPRRGAAVTSELCEFF